MVNLGVLDTAIAVVIVLLLLSLIVQSIQTFLKKLTRFKSKQIEVSLEDLFAQVPQQTPAPAAPGAAPAGPSPAKQMTSAVLEHFEKLGRKSLFGKHALESLSKTDLSKIVAAVQATHILPQEAMTAIQAFYAKVKDVDKAVQDLVKVQLSADAQEKLTQLRAQIAPIKAQVSQLFDTTGNLNKTAVANEILALRNLDTSAIVTIAADLQKSIEAAAAANAGNAALQAALQKAATDAAALAKIVADLNTYLVNATAQLKARFGALESWFDTVMQGFEERYARHMRSWSFAIGLVVAIAMNANIVQIYKDLSKDDIERQRVIAKGAVIQADYTKQIADETTTAPPQNLKTVIDKMQGDLKQNADTYRSLGLRPLDWDGWHEITSTWTTFVKALLGWVIMAFLLSLGAPFWHDALESLFGVKNLLQQKTDQKNVEQGAGEGQTQSS